MTTPKDAPYKQRQKAPFCILTTKDYRPGDLPPEGYLEWHAWADVQRKAGIKQVMCCKCSTWQTPQELSDETDFFDAEIIQANKVVKIRTIDPICKECAGCLK